MFGRSHARHKGSRDNACNLGVLLYNRYALRDSAVVPVCCSKLPVPSLLGGSFLCTAFAIANREAGIPGNAINQHHPQSKANGDAQWRSMHRSFCPDSRAPARPVSLSLSLPSLSSSLPITRLFFRPYANSIRTVGCRKLIDYTQGLSEDESAGRPPPRPA